MVKRHGLLVGVVVGVTGVWLYHHFVHPLPGAAATSPSSGG